MIKNGSRVKLDYELVVDGKTLSSSQDHQPVEYTQGAGEIPEGLEEQLSQLEEGARAEITVPPERGYGNRDPKALKTVAKDRFKEPEAVTPGMQVKVQPQDGQAFQATVSDIRGDEVTLDLNHPLAGKTLHFQVEVLDITPPV